MGIFRKLGWFFKQEKKSYFIGVLFLILVAIVQLVPPRLIGFLADEIGGNRLTVIILVQTLVAIFCVAILQYVFRYIWRVHIWGSAARLEKVLRSNLFKHFTDMDQKFFQTYRTGDLMAHATNDLSAIQQVAGVGILTLVDSLVTGGVTIIAMAVVIDWRLTLMALIPFPFLAYASKKLGDRLHDAFRDSQESFSKMNDKAQESISGMKVIKTFGQEKQDLNDFKTKTDYVVKMNRKVFFLDSLFDPVITIIIGISYILTIIVGGRFVMNQSISIGQLISFINYLNMLIWPMLALGYLFNILERGSASYDRVNELLMEKSTIVEDPFAIQEPAKGDIHFHVTDFHYPEDEKAALKQIDFEIKEGATLGIVGKTGAGKTSILKLMLREHDSYQGNIIFGQYPVMDYSLDALKKSIGYVPQDQFLFSTSIENNIRFSEPDLSHKEVVKFAEMTAIHEDILGFPEGYETEVGERGVSLSGGQKQRISIARALATSPELLILDDALSAVDAKTEEAILKALKNERANKTTIIAAHRLSSVMHAEEIIVVDNGEIIERGTHDTLLALGGWYHDMYRRQQLESKLDGGEA
ncbi:ABC transporter ATP-binding protein [Isobaculum melis]|uniref:ATP-binding cassette, subfamily B n=1 Tax=Isobaculum melis TaxID=142588 RepID=A0A1H9S1U6_9LACT|nr:ABC transporter transmembrane domain-containing protein [Isobaculum melis]SER78914.1 ATP-binding cassette, subfamily B [Isobaculum melis]